MRRAALCLSMSSAALLVLSLHFYALAQSSPVKSVQYPTAPVYNASESAQQYSQALTAYLREVSAFRSYYLPAFSQYELDLLWSTTSVLLGAVCAFGALSLVRFRKFIGIGALIASVFMFISYINLLNGNEAAPSNTGRELALLSINTLSVLTASVFSFIGFNFGAVSSSVQNAQYTSGVYGLFVLAVLIVTFSLAILTVISLRPSFSVAVVTLIGVGCLAVFYQTFVVYVTNSVTPAYGQSGLSFVMGQLVTTDAPTWVVGGIEFFTNWNLLISSMLGGLAVAEFFAVSGLEWLTGGHGRSGS